MSDQLQRLRALIGYSRTIVTVTKVRSDGSAIVTHNDGSTSVAVGQNLTLGKAYLEGDRIIGNAPDLPFTEIIV